MGLYDRDYYRESNQNAGWNTTRRRGWFAGRSVVTILIVINVALYLANGLFCPETNFLTNLLSMHGETLRYPRYWFELLTYGFVQSPEDPRHILFNMIALFFFGPPIERRYGSREFLLFYLLAIVVGGLVWGIANLGAAQAGMLGASGAISAVVILFAFCYPHAQVLVFFIIPMPVWVFGIFYVVMDAIGALGGGIGGNVAHSVHLAGAGLAVVYWFSRIRLENAFSSVSRWKKPRLKIHHVDDTPPQKDDPLEKEVDQILRKISRSGEASLTDAERETLRRASREYQNRKR